MSIKIERRRNGAVNKSTSAGARIGAEHDTTVVSDANDGSSHRMWRVQVFHAWIHSAQIYQICTVDKQTLVVISKGDKRERYNRAVSWRKGNWRRRLEENSVPGRPVPVRKFFSFFFFGGPTRPGLGQICKMVTRAESKVLSESKPNGVLNCSGRIRSDCWVVWNQNQSHKFIQSKSQIYTQSRFTTTSNVSQRYITKLSFTIRDLLIYASLSEKLKKKLQTYSDVGVAKLVAADGGGTVRG